MVFASMNIVPARINHEALKFPEHSVNCPGPDLHTFGAVAFSRLFIPPGVSFRASRALIREF